MKCREIHELLDGCDQEISDATWKFCPRCGSPTGHLVMPDGKVSVPRGKAESRDIYLQNQGFSAVRVNLRMNDEYGPIKIDKDQKREMVVHPRQLTPVKLNFPALESPSRLERLLIEVNDAPLDPPGLDPHQWLWQERKTRTLRVRLEANVETNVEIKPVEEIAIFGKGIMERTLTLRGSNIAKVATADEIDFHAEGFKVERTRIQAGEATYMIRRISGAHIPSESELEILMPDQKSHRVLLYSSQSQQSDAPLPDAIIGIDFGTAFTTIAFRDYLRRPKLSDPVEFLRPPGETKDRFPTRLWLGKDGDRKFGTQATRQHEQDQTSGYLFLQIKTLLREPERAKELILQSPRSEYAVEYATRRYGNDWPRKLVSAYLRWIHEETILPKLKSRYGGADVTVWYVFSLPVLDYKVNANAGVEEVGPQYQLQRAQMIKAIEEAELEGHIEFQFEPVCAALGLLYPHEDKWPRLGSQGREIESNHKIAVFDSGGGTTDVVLMRAEVEEDTRVTLSVESCLGIGTLSETFGGEKVTEDFIEALRDPLKVVMKSGTNERWYSGAMNADVILESVEGKLPRDVAEDLKIQLSAPGNRSINVGHDESKAEIKPVVLERLVVGPILSLTAALNERVFVETDRSETRYYLSVGGNTYLDPVQRWVSGFMQDQNPDNSRKRLLLPEKYRMLAVAYGAAWVPDARIENAVPYDLEVLADNRQLLIFKRNTSQESYTKLTRLPMATGARKSFVFKATINGNSHTVAEASMENTTASGNTDSETILYVWTGVQNGVVSLVCALHDTAANHFPTKENGKELLKYRL